jgi:tetratricopeptide (TPR) repeat protein
MTFTSGVETPDMNGKILTRHSIAYSPVIAAMLLLAAVTQAAAQSAERFAVMVPTFSNKQGGRENFGKDVAEEMQKLIDNMATHESVERDVIRDALRKYGEKEENLNDDNCIKARQLAAQMGVNLVMCGQFTELGDKNYNVEVTVIAPAASQTYPFEPFNATNPKEAAQKLSDQFTRFIEGLQVATYCFQDVEREDWAGALDNCEKALAITPTDRAVNYNKSTALWKTGELQGAYEGFQKVLEIDPAYQNAMLSLGLVASEMGNQDEALRWFNEYLSLNPGDNSVRLHVASEAAKAGNSEAALAILEEGMGDGELDLQLAEYAGLFAMNAAVSKGGSTPEARPFLEKAVRYLEPVLQDKGAEADANLSYNALQAYRLLEQTDKALQFGQQAVQHYPDNPQILSTWADVLNAAGRSEEALATLEKVAQIDPQYANLQARRAVWMIDAGNAQGAIQAAQAGLQAGEIDDNQADAIAQRVIAAGFKLAQAQQFQTAIEYYQAAEPLARTDRTKGMKAFFHAYALYTSTAPRADRQTLADAQATLPVFKRIMDMLNAAAPYCTSSPQAQNGCNSLRTGTTQQIDIQELIIKRGR